MATGTTIPHSRRALLAAAAGGAAALVAGALGRPAPTRATDGDVVTVGGYHTGTSTTYINNESGNTAFQASTNGTGSAIFAHSAGGTGVYGSTYGTAQAAVFGYTPGGGVGVRGVGYSDAPGVMGSSSTLPGSSAIPTKVGVFGYAVQDSTARGVYGRSNTGRGVYGQATSGTGVWGYATSGYALRANGRVKFDTASGMATILSGTKSFVVTPGFDLTSTTKILATLMGNPGGTTAVQRVAVNTTANTFTIYLTAKATANVKVAWLVLS